MKAFIARDLDGSLYLYKPNPPIKGTKEWINEYESDIISRLDDDLFPEVKWEDEEPTEINIEIVNKHQ